MEKPLLLLFVVSDGKFLVRRGDYACFPCIRAERGETLETAFMFAIRKAGRIIYPTGDIEVRTTVESYKKPDGTSVDFMFRFEGEPEFVPVIAQFCVVKRCMPCPSNATLADLEWDTFVKFYQGIPKQVSREAVTA